MPNSNCNQHHDQTYIPKPSNSPIKPSRKSSKVLKNFFWGPSLTLIYMLILEYVCLSRYACQKIRKQAWACSAHNSPEGPKTWSWWGLWLLFVITRPELLVEFSGHPLLCRSRSHLLHKFCQTSGTKAIISIHRASLSYIRPKSCFHCVEEDQNETLP